MFGGIILKDTNRIGEIKIWLMTDYGHVRQKVVAPMLEFLLDYIDDMELPVSTGKREIEKLEKENKALRHSKKMETEDRDYLLGELRDMREKYEPYHFTADDMWDEEDYQTDYSKEIENMYRRKIKDMEKLLGWRE